MHTRTQGLRSRPVYGSGGIVFALPVSNTRPVQLTLAKLTQAVPQGRLNTTTTSRQKSKLAEGSQEGERVVKEAEK